MPVSAEWLARQAPQLAVPAFRAGMERIAEARLRVVGADPAAAPALLLLVKAGFGRIWVQDLSPALAPWGWLGPPSGAADRAGAACAALGKVSRLAQVERYPVGGVPTATLVCAGSTSEALVAAEQARRAGVPHVVLEPDGEGGAVVSVPPGAPCYACGRSPSITWRPLLARGAPLACLAAVELLLVVLGPEGAGRRAELTRGTLTWHRTQRRAACACGQGIAP